MYLSDIFHTIRDNRAMNRALENKEPLPARYADVKFDKLMDGGTHQTARLKFTLASGHKRTVIKRTSALAQYQGDDQRIKQAAQDALQAVASLD